MPKRLTAKVSKDQVAWHRWVQSGLVDPFATPVQTAAGLIGVQAQIGTAAAIAIANRCSDITLADVMEEQHAERSLIKIWGQRHTLHMYDAADWPLIVSALDDRDGWFEKRIAKGGGNLAAYHRHVKRVEQRLERGELLGRKDTRATEAKLDGHRAEDAAWGGSSPYGAGVFATLTRRGVVCHADSVGSETRFAHREHWTPTLRWNPPKPADAKREVVRRYLGAYGPATPSDVAFWFGTTQATVRRCITELKDQVVDIDVDGIQMYVLAERLDALLTRPPRRSQWPVRLLYRFDPLLLAHRDKTWLIDEAHYKRVWRAAGHVEGTVLHTGRIVGIWKYKRTSHQLEVQVEPFTKLPQTVTRHIRGEAHKLASFLGLPNTTLQ